MDDLADLFDSVDGFKEDAMDFGVAGLGAVGANIAYGYLDNSVISKLPVIGTAPALRALAAIVVGVIGGAMVKKYNRNVATGVAVGLATRGVAGLLQVFAPSFVASVVPGTPAGTAGLGLTQDEQNLLLPSGMAAAPAFVEEVSGYGTQTKTVEDVSGLGDGDYVGAFQ